MSRPAHPTRRGLLALLAGTALAWPHPARPQTGAEPPQDPGIGGGAFGGGGGGPR